MDLDTQLLNGNEDILVRSARLGVTVVSGPRDVDLKVACRYSPDVEGVLGDNGILLEVDPSTGEINACTVFNYEEGLFLEAPVLREHLAAYRLASSHRERWEFGVRLFHALLALASPYFAEKVSAAYGASDAATPAKPVVEWLRVRLEYLSNTLKQPASTVISELRNALQNDFLAADVPLQPMGAWSGNLSGSDKRREINQALELIGVDREIALRLGEHEEHGSVLLIEGLRGKRGRSIETFRVQLRRGTEVLLSAESEEHRVMLPLATVHDALDKGADTLVVEVPQD